RLAVAMQVAPGERRPFQQVGLHLVEGGEQPGLATLAREDMSAEIADRGAERQFRLAGRAEFPRRLAGLVIVFVEVDLLFERPVPERGAREIEHVADGLHDTGYTGGIDTAQTAPHRLD